MTRLSSPIRLIALRLFSQDLVTWASRLAWLALWCTAVTLLGLAWGGGSVLVAVCSLCMIGCGGVALGLGVAGWLLRKILEGERL